MKKNEVQTLIQPQGRVLQEYFDSMSPVQIIIGPLGCMRGDTLVKTKQGLARIDSITHGTQVLSYDEKNGRFVYATSGSATLKGKDYLYRIVTHSGEWHVAAHHRALLSSGEYRHAHSLCEGDEVASFGQCQPETMPDYDYSASFVDGLNSCQKSRRIVCRAYAWHSDDLAEPSQEHSHHGQYDDLIQKQGYGSPFCQPYASPYHDEYNSLQWQSVSPFSASIREYLQSLDKFARHHTIPLVSACRKLLSLPSYSSSISQRSIISITRDIVKSEYYDIHVYGTNNYVIDDGTIHHNSGKTIQTCVKIPELMRKQKPNKQGVRLTRWIAARNTYSELFTTTIKDWIECNGHLGEFNQGGKKPPSQLLKFKLQDGTRVESEMIFLAFDRPDHVKKARGIQTTGVWLNEVKELPKAVVDMLDLRHGRYPSKKEGVDCSWHGMLGDSNAPDEDHWLYHLSEEEKPEGWDIFKQPGGVIKSGNNWIINPEAENLNNLPSDYYKRGLQGKGEDWIKVNLGNEYGFVSDGKPVHPRYVDSVHCQDIDFTPDVSREIILGFDWGRTPACGFMQKTAVGGWVCFDEMGAEDMSAITFAPELAKYIRANYAGYKFKGWGDPSGGKSQSTDDTPFQIVKAQGIPCQPTEKSNDVLLRRSAVEIPLRDIGMDGRPRLIVLPKAKMIRKGLAGGFCYKRVMTSGDPKYHDEPDKNKYSHYVEALEYALVGEGEGRKAIKQHESKYESPDYAVNG